MHDNEKSTTFAPELISNDAQMAESVDALVSNTSGATHPGSTPGLGTKNGESYSTLSVFSCHQAMWTKIKYSLSSTHPWICIITINIFDIFQYRWVILSHPISKIAIAAIYFMMDIKAITYYIYKCFIVLFLFLFSF